MNRRVKIELLMIGFFFCTCSGRNIRVGKLIYVFLLKLDRIRVYSLCDTFKSFECRIFFIAR